MYASASCSNESGPLDGIIMVRFSLWLDPSNHSITVSLHWHKTCPEVKPTRTAESDGDIKERQEHVQGEVGKGKVRDERGPTRHPVLRSVLNITSRYRILLAGFLPHQYIYVR